MSKLLISELQKAYANNVQHFTWNSLPAEVTSSNSMQTFKIKLKCHLFLALFP